MKKAPLKDYTSSDMPIKTDLDRIYMLSWLIAFLMAIASLLGLFWHSTIYPTMEARESFLANDAVNLIIGLPALLLPMWLTRHGHLVGLLLWPGAIAYVLYNSIAVLFGVPLGPMTLLYGSLIFLSAITGIRIVRSMEPETVKDRLSGLVYERMAGIVLLLFGVGFALLAISMVVEAISKPGTISSSDLSVSISDLVVSWIWILGGIWIFRKTALGYATGLGLLFAVFTLIIGLILFLFFRPVLTDVPFDVAEVIPILIFGVICVIPFTLFLRGVMKADRIDG